MIHRRVLDRAGEFRSSHTASWAGKSCRRQSSARRWESASSSPSRPRAMRTVFVSIPKMRTFISNRRIKELWGEGLSAPDHRPFGCTRNQKRPNAIQIYCSYFTHMALSFKINHWARNGGNMGDRAQLEGVERRRQDDPGRKLLPGRGLSTRAGGDGGLCKRFFVRGMRGRSRWR